jgi:hypothetical protein
MISRAAASLALTVAGLGVVLGLAGEIARADVAPDGPRAECRDAHLASFRVFEDSLAVTLDEGTGADFCAPSGPPLTPALRGAIRELGALNLRASAYLDAEPGALFGGGVHAGLVRLPEGILGSFYHRGTTGVYLGVYPDWNGEPLNAGVYLHELGHALAAGASPALPPVLHELASTTLMVETFADFLALGVAGRVFAESRQIAPCLARTRIVGKYQTYGFPRAFFDPLYSTRKLVSCCKYLAAHPQSPGVDENSRSLCEGVRQVESVLPPLDRRTEFDPAEYARNPRDFDPHQVGIPLNSFFRALDQELAIPARGLLMSALWTVTASDRLTCDLPAAGVTAARSVSVRVTSFAHVLARMRDLVSSEKQAEFDEISRRHQLSKAVLMAQRDVEVDAAAPKAFASVQPDSPCAIPSTDPACQLVCTRQIMQD